MFNSILILFTNHRLLKPTLFIDLVSVFVFLLRFNVGHLNVAFWVTCRISCSSNSSLGSLRTFRQKIVISLRFLFLLGWSCVDVSFELRITLHEFLVLKLFFPRSIV